MRSSLRGSAQANLERYHLIYLPLENISPRYFPLAPTRAGGDQPLLTSAMAFNLQQFMDMLNELLPELLTVLPAEA